ncbi:hypothetical protein VNO78_06344 [Psophocarpus tetragonolobus]|uniref:EGF-like domain-containing protein n=1 Tax=Psophocarpus tetragonolobus TaxID=3891 RepID=A0AAN9SSA7_PSOTE
MAFPVPLMLILASLVFFISKTSSETDSLSQLQPLSDGNTLVSKEGLNRYLTTWKNWEDPSSGHFAYGVSRSNIPEMQIWNGSSVFYRSGPWSGFRFSATPVPKRRSSVNINFVDTPEESYYQLFPRNKSTIIRTVANQTVFKLQRFVWVEEDQNWKLDLVIPRDDFCGYNHCGSYGFCAVKDNSSTCECLRGFEPKSPQNWSEGCVNRSETWKWQDLYVRLDISTIGKEHADRSKIVVATAVSFIIVMLLILTFVYQRKKTKFRGKGNIS